MKPTTSLKLVRRLFLSGLAFAGLVACSSRAPEPVDAVTARQTTNAPQEATCSASAGEEACAMCCAGDGPAKPIFEATAQCFEACGDDDEACWDRCWEAYDDACAAAGDACTAAEECIEKSCYGDCNNGGNDDGNNRDNSCNNKPNNKK